MEMDQEIKDQLFREYQESLSQDRKEKNPGTIVIEDEPKRPLTVKIAKDFPIKTWGMRILDEPLDLRSENEEPNRCDHIETLPPGTALLWMIPEKTLRPDSVKLQLNALKRGLNEMMQQLLKLKEKL